MSAFFRPPGSRISISHLASFARHRKTAKRPVGRAASPTSGREEEDQSVTLDLASPIPSFPFQQGPPHPRAGRVGLLSVPPFVPGFFFHLIVTCRPHGPSASGWKEAGGDVTV